MKLINLLLPVTCLAIIDREHSRLLTPRLLAPITFPEGCTAEQKPDDEIFCVTAILGNSGGLHIDLLVNIFDAEDASKSTYVDMQASLDGSTPTGLNITGGGCADVYNKDFGGVLEGTVELCFDALPEGIGKLDPNTGYWNASLGVAAEGIASIFGKDISVKISDTIDAHFGPNFDIGFVVSREKSTGDDNRLGLAIGIDLSLNTMNNALFSWELATTVKFRGWFRPFFDEEVERELFKREFQIPLR